MAKSVGLVPHEQWRWALRHMRDSRGNLLTGQALAKAKKALGKMDNNKRQEFESAVRRVGGHREILAAEDASGNFISRARPLQQEVVRSQESTSAKRDNKRMIDSMVGIFSPREIDLKDPYKRREVIRNIRKARADLKVKDTLTKSTSDGTAREQLHSHRDGVNVGTSKNVSTEIPLSWNKAKDTHYHPFSPAARNGKGRLGARLRKNKAMGASPSGLERTGPNPDHTLTGGDVEHYKTQTEYNTPFKGRILSGPYEGIHKIRGTSKHIKVRSVYFDNTPHKSRA